MILAGPLLGVGAKFGYRVSFVVATGLAVGGFALLMAARTSRRADTNPEATEASLLPPVTAR